MERLLFGCAGIPLSTVGRSTPDGISRIREIGLDAMELEFVRGVRMGDDLAGRARSTAVECDVTLTAHGPYYINLASEKTEVRERSVERILNTARVARACGGRSVTFHCGYYFRGDGEESYRLVGKGLREVMDTLEAEDNRLRISPEVMGKRKSFGKLPEILRLCEEVEGIHPCLDFAHLHAYKGAFNTYEEYAYLFEEIESRLGWEELKEMHLHISGVEYGEKGERRHLNLEDSDLDFRSLLLALRDFDCRGVLICESPSIEGDAMMLKREYAGIEG